MAVQTYMASELQNKTEAERLALAEKNLAIKRAQLELENMEHLQKMAQKRAELELELELEAKRNTSKLVSVTRLSLFPHGILPI